MKMRDFVNGLRVRTLPASIAPVAVGAAAAWYVLTDPTNWDSVCVRQSGSPDPVSHDGTPTRCLPVWTSDSSLLWRFALAVALCAVVAVCFQIAVNFANDYSDGLRGADAGRAGSESQTGRPQRLTEAGVNPKAVLGCAAAFALAGCAAGVAAAALSGQWWIVALGALCVIAGWFYTGGKHPYGYSGWGEAAVFVFFGLVATLGTEFVVCQSFTGYGVGERYTSDFSFSRPMIAQEGAWQQVLAGRYGVDIIGFCGAVAVGFNAVMILMVNNLRDIDTDPLCGKQTFAVRLGPKRAQAALGVVAVASFAVSIIAGMCAWMPWGNSLMMLQIPTLLGVMVAADRKRYGRALRYAGLQSLVFAALMVLSCVFGAM